MNVLTVCCAAVIASILALFLKKQNAEYSLILTVCTASIIFIYITGAVLDAITSINDIFSASKMSTTYLTVLLKCVGICFLTEFTSDTCKDTGQAALSNIVVFCGRIFVMITALPLFTELLGIVTELSGG